MEQTPYTNFWKEEPENQRQAWRPTDESRRRLQMFGFIQFLLLGAIVVLGMMIARETKRVPRIFAQLPDGLVFETIESHPYIHRLARMELVNNTLALLYYQEGANNYLGYLTNNVRKTILADVVRGMALAKQKTNSTVQLTIDETFETSSSPRHLRGHDQRDSHSAGKGILQTGAHLSPHPVDLCGQSLCSYRNHGINSGRLQ